MLQVDLSYVKGSAVNLWATILDEKQLSLQTGADAAPLALHGHPSIEEKVILPKTYGLEDSYAQTVPHLQTWLCRLDDYYTSSYMFSAKVEWTNPQIFVWEARW